jgi:hypothetical protein
LIFGSFRSSVEFSCILIVVCEERRSGGVMGW